MLNRFLRQAIVIFVLVGVFFFNGYTTYAAEIKHIPRHEAETKERSPSLIQTIKNILGADLVIRLDEDRRRLKKISSSYTHYIMGVIFENQDKSEQAKLEFLKARKLAPEEKQICLRLASVSISLNQIDEAIKYINGARKLDPDDVSSSFLLALLYISNKEWEKATAEYEKIIEKHPHNIAALSSLADIYIIEDKLEEAIRIYEKLIQERPEVPQLYFNRGIIYIKLEKKKEAVESFIQATEADKSYIDAYIFSSGLLLEGDEKKQAISVLKEGIKSNPENIRLLLFLGSCFY